MAANDASASSFLDVLKLEFRHPANRFTADFVPEAGSNAPSQLVHEALAYLRRRRKIVKRQRIPYQICEVPKPRHCVHVIDQQPEADKPMRPLATSENAESRHLAPNQSSKSRPHLADLFNRSGTGNSSSQMRSSRRAMMSAASFGANAQDPQNEEPSSSSTQTAECFTEDQPSLDPNELVQNGGSDVIDLRTAGTAANILFDEYESDGLLWRYQPDYQYHGPLEVIEAHRVPVGEWGHKKSDAVTKLLISAKRLTLSIGHFEPLFCTLTLYDLREGGGRMSECFHFDLNSEEVLSSSLSVMRFSADEITLCKNAIFTINDRHEGIHLVLRIERVLQGDPDSAFDPYLKDKKFMGSQRPKNELEKISKKIRTTINRLAKYRQSFAVAVLPLFTEGGEMINPQPTHIMDKLFVEKQASDDGVFLEQLREFASLQADPNASNRRKAIPSAEFAFEATVLEESMPPNVVDPSLIPLKPPGPDQQMENPIESVVREIESLPLPSEIVAKPHDHFVNSLYVYPLRVQFQKYRNIACQVELRLTDTSLEGESINSMFGKSSGSAFCSSGITQVAYHNRNPSMLDEFKFMLPLHLNEHAHLFFTFFQVACQKKVGKPAEEVIGYSVMPMFKGNQVAPDGVYSLPIAARLPDHYLLKFEARKESPHVHFRMQSADCFQVRLHSLSSVFCQDVCLNKFLNTLPNDDTVSSPTRPSMEDTRVVAPGSDDESHSFPDPVIETAIDYLRHAQSFEIVQFLPPLLNHLFGIVHQSRSRKLQCAAFRSIDVVVYRVGQYLDDSSFRTNLIAEYVAHIFDGTGSEEHNSTPLCLRILELLLRSLKELDTDEGNTHKQIVARNIWFWFEVIFKGLSLEKLQGTLNDSMRLVLAKDLKELLVMMTVRIAAHRSVMGVSALKAANSSIALLLCDLFLILESSAVVELIVLYFENIDALKDSVLLDFKIRFLDILFDCDHFLAISGLYQDPPPLHSTAKDVIHQLEAAYPLPAMFVRFVDFHLDFGEKTVRGQIIACARRIMTKHDRDSSVGEKHRAIMATMYLPLLQALADQVTVVNHMALKQQRDILAVALWVLKTSNRAYVSEWIRTEDDEILSNFCILLRICVQCFAYAGKVKRRDQTEFDSIISAESASAILGVDASEIGTDLKSNIENLMSSLRKGAASLQSQSVKGRSKLSLRQRRAQMASASGSVRRSRKNDYNTETLKGSGGSELLKTVLSMEAVLNANVGSAVAQFILQVLMSRWATVSESSSLASSFVLLLSSMLNHEQELSVTLAVYPLIRYTVTSTSWLFSTVQLRNDVGELSRGLLGHCTRSNVKMRSAASALLFLIARANYMATQSFEVFQESVTISLSQMVSQLGGKPATFLEQSFRAVNEFAKFSSLVGASKERLSGVMTRVLGILEDTREIARQEALGKAGLADLSVYAELLVHMSEAYSHLPRVRQQWLRKLADHYTKHGNHAEASQALQELSELTKKLHMVDSNEKDWRDIELQTGMSLYQTLTGIMRETCIALDRAQLYEQCNQCYKDLIPVYERHFDYKQLSKAHLHLHTVFDQLVASIQSQSRLLGTYYRVGFYGDSFGSSDGKQFIYKMPKITRLAEVVDYIKGTYGRQFGFPIRIWPDSGAVDQRLIKPGEGVVQVTYVTPFFDEDDDDRRKSFVQRNTNLEKFSFSTPFTSAGAAHSNDVTKQQKRNTILSVRYPFPCLLTRQPIVSVQETILSPIESSTENITTRVDKIKEILRQDNPDKKVLTNVLQGSVMLQVHGGAKEICYAFFGDGSSDRPSPFAGQDGLDELRCALIEFLDVCESAIELYGKMIAADEKSAREASSTASPGRLEARPSSLSGNINDTTAASSTDRVLHTEFDKHLRRLRQEMMPSLRTSKKKSKANVRFA